MGGGPSQKEFYRWSQQEMRQIGCGGEAKDYCREPDCLPFSDGE